MTDHENSRDQRKTKARLIHELQSMRQKVADSDRLLDKIISIYKEAPIGLCYFDKDLRFLHINDWLAAINGMPVEEHLGRTISEVVPEVAAGVESQLRHVIETGEPLLGGTVDAETPAHSEVTRTFEHNYYPIKSGDNTVVGVSCVVEDITERKRSEEALAKKSSLLETTLENMAQGIAVYDADYKLVSFNERFSTIFGLPPGFLHQGMSIDEIVRQRHKQGHYKEDIDEIVGRRRKALASPERSSERTLPNGTVVAYHRQPMPGGGCVTTHTDITDRKRSEEALAEVSALLKTTFESMNQGIKVYDADLKLVAFNQKFINFSRYPPGFIRTGLPYEDIVRFRAKRGAYGTVDDIDALVRKRVAARRKSEAVRHEHAFPDGRIIAISRDPILGGGYVQTFTDITERKRAEEALQKAHEVLESRVEERTRELRRTNQALRSETAERKEISTALEEAKERFRQLVESTNAIPWEADAKTWIFTYIGPQAVELLGYPRELWLEKDFWVEHIHPEDRAKTIDYCLKSLAQRTNYEFEYRMLAADGRTIWLHDIVNVVEPDGEPVALRGFMIDITERKSLEESQRNISSRLISAQEEERRKISRELHDDFGQRLALLAVGIQSLSQQMPEPESETVKSMDNLWSQTQKLSTDLHRLSHQLHPAILDQLGLGPAIRSLCSEISEQHGIQIKFTEHQVQDSIPRDISLCLYRTAQEGLRNIVKHSGAKDAKVELTGAPDTIHLRIADQGVGFDPITTNRKGLGLVSIEERIRVVKGEMSLQSRLSHGTCIDLRIPLAAPDT